MHPSLVNMQVSRFVGLVQTSDEGETEMRWLRWETERGIRLNMSGLYCFSPARKLQGSRRKTKQMLGEGDGRTTRDALHIFLFR